MSASEKRPRLDSSLRSFSGRREVRIGRAAALHLARLQHAHRRLFKKIAFETFMIAISGPGFEPKERRVRPRPQSRMRKVAERHFDRGAASADEFQRPA